MSEQLRCGICGRLTDDFEHCIGCDAVVCGDCAVQDVDDSGNVVWRCEDCDEDHCDEIIKQNSKRNGVE